MTNKILLFHPHGLGDCILATPAIREYKKQTGNYIGFATQYRFKSAGLFRNFKYIDELVYTKDAWLNYKSFPAGCNDIKAYLNQFAQHNKFDQVIPIMHSQSSKINDVAKILGVHPLKNNHTEVVITEEDTSNAKELLASLGIDYEKDFGFAQTHCGLHLRDFPEGYAAEKLKEMGMATIFEVGVGYDPKSIPITVEYAIMELAKKRVLPNSCFYHAACALDLKIDLAYFADGQKGFNKVQHLHDVDQTVVFEL